MSRILTRQSFQIVVLFVFLLLAVFQSFSDSRWRQQIRNFTFDTYNIMQPRVDSGQVAIVDIDEASLEEVGQMPWPRTVMGDLVKKLNELGAKVIVFDIVFSEADRSSPAALMEAFDGQGDLKQQLENLPDNDALFGEVIKEAGNVITGFSFTNEETGKTPRQIGIFRGRQIEKYVPNLQGVSANLKVISKNAAGNGSFFVSTDTDGIIRRVPMMVAHRPENAKIVSVYPSLSLETVRFIAGENGGQVILADQKYAALDPARFGIEGIQLGRDKLFVPTNAKGEFLVYFSESRKDWYISAHDVLGGRISPEQVKDKIILIGTSAVGLKDIRSTPLETFRPGVEVHLNIIDQILQGKFLRRSIEAEGVEAVSILIIGMFIIIAAQFVGILAQLSVIFMAVFGALYAGWYGFVNQGLLVDVTYPVLSILLIFMISTILTYLRTEQEKRQVREAFGLYISPDFMKELTRDPDKLKLGGEIRDLTVMFTDIRNFTSISEGLSPEELIQLMNDFLTPMSDLVMQNRGTIDKYMGDAMMAFWNAPLDDPDHVRHACRAALGMQAALAPINEAVKKKAEANGKEPVLLKAGIGINTGPCAVGNMGSRQRFAYSTLGDAVNLASRLEGQTKTYGVGILMGEDSYEDVQDFAALEVDLIRVKGKTKPVRVFALLGDEKEAKTAMFKEIRMLHAAMLDRYREADFKGALDLVKQCADLDFPGLERVYEIYRKRAAAFSKNPPPGDWDGVYEAESK